MTLRIRPTMQDYQMPQPIGPVPYWRKFWCRFYLWWTAGVDRCGPR